MQLRSENVNINSNGPKPSERPMATRRRALTDISNNAPCVNTAPGPGPPVTKPPVVVAPVVAPVPVRVYMQREPSDVDERDKLNPNCCTEVINEMFHSFRAVEVLHAIDGSYMSGQAHLNSKMRRILVDWLVDIHARFKMVPETLYLAVNYIDRYLQVTHDVRRSKLQLVGITAMFIASKYEEIYPPSVDQYVKITDRAYTKKEILAMEFNMCGALQFQLTVPTAHSFLCRTLKAANVNTLEMVQLCSYITERSLQEYQMLQFRPSVVAAAAVSIARQSSNRYPWSPTLVRYIGYDECDIADCIAEMRTYLSAPPDSADQTTVYKKYSSSKYGRAAQTHLTF